ncbi:uncharacterized protein LAESUDRAFT_563810 [Laetiporus sulphureus 93-53]|uniref:Uncharacterized protein n=1 Tax=Laetiporus sulphureus 93-53 TaxID=1314785 RepID=A0A165B492_9APHY|nr:uncharacterized protein LAESUDRAFT_563810 [Laetiporus sulphureus 93-53]KZT00196.1 hypothetical protein LAESUDRAFT_563810 [Laetiporus sulphureus 93-53]
MAGSEIGNLDWRPWDPPFPAFLPPVKHPAPARRRPCASEPARRRPRECARRVPDAPHLPHLVAVAGCARVTRDRRGCARHLWCDLGSSAPASHANGAASTWQNLADLHRPGTRDFQSASLPIRVVISRHGRTKSHPLLICRLPRNRLGIGPRSRPFSVRPSRLGGSHPYPPSIHPTSSRWTRIGGLVYSRAVNSIFQNIPTSFVLHSSIYLLHNNT